MTNEFGRLLRQHRNRCRDPLNGKPLTLERLGALLGEAGADAGFSPVAISNWGARPQQDPCG